MGWGWYCLKERKAVQAWKNGSEDGPTVEVKEWEDRGMKWGRWGVCRHALGNRGGYV